MLLKNSFAVLLAVVSVQGQSATTQCCTIDPSSVSATTRASWCRAQTNTCSTLCASGTSTNTCDSSTFSYNCVCSSGLSPNLDNYAQTIPSLLCNEWKAQCIAAEAGSLSGQTACQAYTCGSQTASAVDVSTAASSIAVQSSTSASSSSSRLASSSTLATSSSTREFSDSSEPSSSATSSQNNAQESPVAGSGGGGLGGGAIAGIVIGALVGLAIIIFLLWWFCLRQKKNQQGQEQQQPPMTDIDRNPHQPGLEVGDRATGRPELGGQAKELTRGIQAAPVPYAAPPVHELRSNTSQRTSRHELPSPASTNQASPTPQYAAPQYSAYPERAEHEFNVNPMPEYVNQDPEIARLEQEMQETRAQMDRLQQMHALNLREQQLREEIERRRVGGR